MQALVILQQGPIHSQTMTCFLGEAWCGRGRTWNFRKWRKGNCYLSRLEQDSSCYFNVPQLWLLKAKVLFRTGHFTTENSLFSHVCPLKLASRCEKLQWPFAALIKRHPGYLGRKCADNGPAASTKQRGRLCLPNQARPCNPGLVPPTETMTTSHLLWPTSWARVESYSGHTRSLEGPLARLLGSCSSAGTDLEEVWETKPGAGSPSTVRGWESTSHGSQAREKHTNSACRKFLEEIPLLKLEPNDTLIPLLIFKIKCCCFCILGVGGCRKQSEMRCSILNWPEIRECINSNYEVIKHTEAPGSTPRWQNLNGKQNVSQGERHWWQTSSPHGQRGRGADPGVRASRGGKD